MATSTPWAVLLCRFSDHPEEPKPPEYFRTLFGAEGAGMGGLFDYWRDISYGAVDLTGTDVFGWFELDHTLEEDRKLDRLARILKGIQAAVDNDVDLKPYFGIIVVLNVPEIDWGSASRRPLTFGGVTKIYGLAVLDVGGWRPTAAAHEMGHGYGLADSWSAGTPDVMYGNIWDIMSALNVYMFANPTFGSAGPGLGAAFLQILGWMPPDRIAPVDASGTFDTTLTLAALGHPEASGPLMARLDLVEGISGMPFTYVIEYRQADRWDAGIPQHVVLVNEVRMNGLVYLKRSLTLPGGPPIPGTSRPDQYIDGKFGFGVAVEAIDPASGQAQIRISSGARVELTGDVVTLFKSAIDTGVYKFPGTKVCPKASFAYTEFTQHQTATFQALPEFFDATLTLEWYLDSTPLYSAGTVALSVTSRSALPPPSGELEYGAEALVDYKVTGAQIALSNRPEDGSYDCVLRVIAKDATGRTASAQITLTFLGEVLEFESKYYDAMAKCLAMTKAFVSKIKTKPKPFMRGCDLGPFKKKKKKIADTVRDIVRKRPGMADGLDKAFGHVPGVGLHSGLPKRSKKKQQQKKKKKQKPKPG